MQLKTVPEETYYATNETGMAEWARDHAPFPVVYDVKRKQWYFFRKHWWERDEGQKTRLLVMSLTRQRENEAARDGDHDIAKAVRNTLMSARGTDGILKQLASIMGKSSAKLTWDARPDLLGVANGIVDLRTGGLRDGDPADLVRSRARESYDPHAEAPRWRRFVLEVFGGDEAMAEFFQRAIGYSITGETSAQKWFMMYGRGRNGKSTALEYHIVPILGDLAQVARIETFTRQHNRSGIPSDIKAMEWKRMVLTSEPASTDQLDEARLKQLTTGGRVRARDLYQAEADAGEFDAQLKLWMATNYNLTVKDDSEGNWRRILRVPFEQQFDPDAEPGLPAALKRERPGVLTWAVEGAAKWYADEPSAGPVGALRVPAKVTHGTQEYREEQDELADFVAERVDSAAFERGERKVVTRRSTMYRTFEAWAKAQGQRYPMSPTAFNEKLDAKFPGSKGKAGGVKAWIGLAVKNDDAKGAY